MIARTPAVGSGPGWPDTTGLPAPRGHLYRSATWLLGRHSRLAHLAVRVRGVIEPDPDDPAGEPVLNLDHLACVIAATGSYATAWEEYENQYRAPQDEREFELWRQAGPDPDDIAPGLSDFLVMSSGEVASLRLLATLASEPVAFRVGDLFSLDAEGQRLLADWTTAVRAA